MYNRGSVPPPELAFSKHPVVKPSLFNFSVEEENLASIPFAVLERRVGKRVSKLELTGNKTLPDGTEVRVTWQVQGNSELGLPTEQDLDLFVALGMLTFQNNFQKTVTFTGREIARLLNISGVHGRFYQRLKLAMDRFIPLRFRAITETDHQEEVKWLNVFQEASFTLDRSTGRCVGSVTWTDKLIESMNCGFFRLLDAGRYMELDGLTAKHLYRYLTVAFEKTDMVVMDARKLSTEHLGIVNLPKHFSRLLQTLEPAFDQLVRVQVLSAYHVISHEDWTVALHRHPEYKSGSRTLIDEVASESPDLRRACCERLLVNAGLQNKLAADCAQAAVTRLDFYMLERAARLLEGLEEHEVLPHVALSLIRKALDEPRELRRETLDWCEIAIEICRQKRAAGQKLRNPAGLLIKIVRDSDARARLVPKDLETALKHRFHLNEQAVLSQERDAEQRRRILEYEAFRHQLAQRVFEDQPDERKRVLRKEKTEFLKQQERFERMSPAAREQEIDALIIHDLERTEAPPFAKWFIRKQAEQAVLPFDHQAAIA
jgi:hypothetical protein